MIEGIDKIYSVGRFFVLSLLLSTVIWSIVDSYNTTIPIIIITHKDHPGHLDSYSKFISSVLSSKLDNLLNDSLLSSNSSANYESPLIFHNQFNLRPRSGFAFPKFDPELSVPGLNISYKSLVEFMKSKLIKINLLKDTNRSITITFQEKNILTVHINHENTIKNHEFHIINVNLNQTTGDVSMRILHDTLPLVWASLTWRHNDAKDTIAVLENVLKSENEFKKGMAML